MTILGLRRQSSGLGLSPRRRGAKGAATPPNPAEADIQALAPNAWYKFDEGSGTGVTDYSGNGHGGTNSGGYSWSSAGLTYNGSNGITTFDNAGVSGATPLTLLAAYTPVTANHFAGGWEGTGANGTELAGRNNTPGTTLVTYYGPSSNSISIDVSGTAARLLMGRMTGTNYSTFAWRRDGGSDVASGASQAMNLSANLVLGAAVNGTLFRNFTVHYCLTWARAISDGEYTTARNAIRTLLALRGVTLP